MRILIVEDEPDLLKALARALRDEDYAVDTADNGADGLFNAESIDYDAIVLDVGLPGMNGGTLCRKLREEANNDTPVLMLTARDTLEDKLEGFARGADDYLVKPFALKEVEARLTALHKRHAGRVAQRPLTAGDITFDPRTLAVRFRGADVSKLSPKCLRLLETLMAEPERVFSRKELETAVWGDAQDTSDTLRSHMHVLRRELSQAGGYDPIENVHGLGYRVVPREKA